ncbi:molybdopterin-dependent oxidoreductase [Phenylobacterium sp.]|uniref:molybdopterin-dependent oxidoreductase n=1 Tax=Phenylobacterium sp. TaxID=1871053 RepID=UPI0025EE9DB7|nr:molybdopterin-dependent oxidoreductase [Phenylobacterium sp.]MBX3485969.1 molybdopterin-dependent oxidoreductase [Phenylobacterium sp.]MCW5758519.1 molybdopterin-dependent oxidoreductase [Phenylobacterium sp.]
MSTDRRHWLKGAGAALAGLWLAACDKLTQDPRAVRVLRRAETLTYRAQRAATDRRALAREFTVADISKDFRANGSTRPDSEAYQAMLADNFADYRLVIDGLVEQPRRFSLGEIRAMPARSQITRHDCVEGWSSIGKWKGARLGPLLDLAGLKPAARYVVFHCADTLEQTLDGTGQYYESIDLIDAYHPQTILAYEMNDATLPVRHGAPLRLRVERQLGYKQAKYVMRIEVVDRLDGVDESGRTRLGRGRGGYWPDRGYEWYAGI